MAKHKWKLIAKYPIETYKCGLVSGQKIRLKKGYAVLFTDGTPSGKKHPTGEIWTVINGAVEDPAVVWLRDASGAVCTWDDDQTIFEDFELVAEVRP